jgi:hypothetical protein
LSSLWFRAAGGATVCSSCGTTPLAQAAESHPVAWTVVAAQGPLALGESAYEYAVYDADRTYGRWPKTRDGYRLASEAYGAYAQSLAHGVAYRATGYQDPARLGLPTAPVVKSQTYAAPLSLVGSTRRITRWVGGAVERNPQLRVPLYVLMVLAVLVAWATVLTWYLVVFGLFGIFMIPYRLIRRSQRKSLHVQQTALATQQAMYQHMTMMQQRAQWQGPGNAGPNVPQGVPGHPPSEPTALPPS